MIYKGIKMKNWRINFGNGQVSSSFKTKREAESELNKMKARGDLYVSHFFIQKQIEPGWWVKAWR